jgi:hypothetical protein
VSDEHAQEERRCCHRRSTGKSSLSGGELLAKATKAEVPLDDEAKYTIVGAVPARSLESDMQNFDLECELLPMHSSV